jgi:DNA-binding response OmpR family regulator
MPKLERRVPASVAIIKYPSEASALADLRRRGLPRLLLVAARAAPPDDALDPLEDWVRVPADPVEVDVRADLLARRHGDALRRRTVELGAEGVVRRNGPSVVLTPVEHALLDVLLASEGAIVPRLILEQTARGAGSTMPLKTRMARLRTRIEPLRLAVHVVRGRGYLLEALPVDGPSSS